MALVTYFAVKTYRASKTKKGTLSAAFDLNNALQGEAQAERPVALHILG